MTRALRSGGEAASAALAGQAGPARHQEFSSSSWRWASAWSSNLLRAGGGEGVCVCEACVWRVGGRVWEVQQRGRPATQGRVEGGREGVGGAAGAGPGNLGGRGGSVYRPSRPAAAAAGARRRGYPPPRAPLLGLGQGVAGVHGRRHDIGGRRGASGGGGGRGRGDSLPRGRRRNHHRQSRPPAGRNPAAPRGQGETGGRRKRPHRGGGGGGG